MRFLKMPYIAAIGGVVLLLLGVGVWQLGWLDGDTEFYSPSSSASGPAVHPADARVVNAVILAAEIQLLREQLGESGVAQRESANAARVKAWTSGVPAGTLAELRAERAALAQRYFAQVENALAHPQWPTGAEAYEGDAAFYEAKARDLLAEARTGFIYADARGISARYDLDNAAHALVIARGKTTRPMPFSSSLETDAKLAMVYFIPVGLTAPQRPAAPAP